MSARNNGVAIVTGRRELAHYLDARIQEGEPGVPVHVNPPKISSQDLLVVEVPAIDADTAEWLWYLDELQPRELVLFSPPDVLSQSEMLRLLHGRRRRPAYLLPYDAPTVQAWAELARLVLGILSDAPAEAIIAARLDAERRLKVTTADLRCYRVRLEQLEIPDVAALDDADIEVDPTLYAITIRGELSIPLHTIRYHGDEKYRRQQDAWAQREQDSLGNRIRELREQRQLKQEELAASAGLSRKQLSQIENGHARPQAATLDRLAQALGLTVAELLRGLDLAVPA